MIPHCTTEQAWRAAHIDRGAVKSAELDRRRLIFSIGQSFAPNLRILALICASLTELGVPTRIVFVKSREVVRCIELPIINVVEINLCRHQGV